MGTILLVVLGVVLLSVVGILAVRAIRARSLPRPSEPSVEVSGAPTEPATTPETGAATPTGPPAETEVSEVEVESGPPAYRERLGKSRGLFASLRSLGGRSKVDAATLGELEDSLLRADVGVATADHLLSRVKARAEAKEIDDVDGLLGALRSELIDLLTHDADGTVIDRSLRTTHDEDRVCVWLFVGVNGVGKTTTIGKLAAARTQEGSKVLLAAGDTFRAAAADQLSMWGERSGAEVVRGSEGGDPSAVVFDAIQRGKARGVDLVLADTAGRLHTKVNLIEELKKIRRVADREPGQVAEVLLVLDATTGQNAVVQARQFSEAVEATGVVLTKLDGTARGGVVVAIQRELGLPVKLVGLGEGTGDLVAFDPVEFVDALLEP